MNKIIVTIIIALLSYLTVFATDSQPMPKNTDLTLQNKRKILSEVTAKQIIETDKVKGIIATYNEIYNQKKAGKTIDFWAGTWSWSKNETHEDVFIVGLNHDLVTTNGLVYHVDNDMNQHFLGLWPIGIAKMKRNGVTIRLKKYTVNPEDAKKHYKNKDIMIDGLHPMPKNTDISLQNKRKILSEVVAIQVIENEKHNGVVATYDEIYNQTKPGKTIDFWAGTWSWSDNETHEDVFIVGLNHDLITQDGLIYHLDNGMEQHFLGLWPIGIEAIQKNGSSVRLKKFTVNPEEAKKYYSKQNSKK